MQELVAEAQRRRASSLARSKVQTDKKRASELALQEVCGLVVIGTQRRVCGLVDLRHRETVLLLVVV